jgi:hypothetical protein
MHVFVFAGWSEPHRIQILEAAVLNRRCSVDGAGDFEEFRRLGHLAEYAFSGVLSELSCLGGQ